MKETYFRIDEFLRTNRLGTLGTVINGHPVVCPQGLKFLLNEREEELLGLVNEEIIHLLTGAVLEVHEKKVAKFVEIVYQGLPLSIFLDPIYPEKRLVILGGGHIAVALVNLGQLLGFQITVVDDRPEFATAARFPTADHVLCKDFELAIKEMPVDANTFVIIVTRGHRHDKTCLKEMLHKEPFAYVGMIGSRHKVKALFSELVSDGFSGAMLKNVHAPIGLDIGAQTPEEIAVSILAEIIMVERYGYSTELKARTEGM